MIVTGPCGIGKSFIACAFVERACRRSFAARYVRMPRLLHELAVGRGDGSYTRLLAAWPSSTCSRSTTGCSRRCATPSGETSSR